MTAVEVPLDQADAVALLTRQTAILEQIATGAPLADVLTDVTATLEDLVPDCHCSVLLLEPTGVLRHGAAPSLPVAYSAQIDGLRIGAAAGSCGTAAWSGEAVIASDIHTDARWTDYRVLADAYGLRACWSTPIRGRDGAVSGTFAVYHRRPHRPTDREERLVERLTHLASVAIDHDGLLGALAESEERFRRAFEDNAVGVALTTLDGGITQVNRAMQALLERDADTLVGTRLDDVVVRRPGSGDARAYEATATSATGRQLDLAVTVSQVRDAADVPRALSVNVLDVTGRHAAERERRARVAAEAARTAAETANRAKTDFVAALGHELRTPLQAITGFAEVLGTLDLDDTRRSAALGHITAAAGHILEIVGDVLDVARIEVQALPLCRQDLALGPVVAEVVAMTRTLAEAERVMLHDTTAPAQVRVHADERRVTQVLLNLVANAIRYNRADGDVWIDWRGDAAGVTVTVRDTGPGIAPEHRDRLFTPFDRLGRDAEEGVGLGLPLARGLTEAMGGTLEVDSVVGHGTTVSVVLPAAG